jgi:hypothetical protein
MRKSALLLLIPLLATLYLLLNTGLALGQASTRVITIVPPTREIALNPGEKTEGTLKVINDSSEPITFNATVRDYVVNDKAGTPDILPPNTLSNKYSAASWVATVPEQFTIQPHEKQELTFYLQIPADAHAGGHYAAVVYEPTDIIGVKGTGTGVQTQIGTLLYINVKGQITEKANVAQFKAKGFSEYGPISVTTEIANQGDLHIKPIGKITVKTIFGKVVDTKSLEEHNIFPDRSLLYQNKLGKHWMIGPYTATLNAVYGQNSNLPLKTTISFIVFPWKVTAIVILIIAIVILAIMALRRRKKSGPQGQPESKDPAPVEPQAPNMPTI